VEIQTATLTGWSIMKDTICEEYLAMHFFFLHADAVKQYGALIANVQKNNFVTGHDKQEVSSQQGHVQGVQYAGKELRQAVPPNSPAPTIRMEACCFTKTIANVLVPFVVMDEEEDATLVDVAVVVVVEAVLGVVVSQSGE
jgi:hypothetical protein